MQTIPSTRRRSPATATAVPGTTQEPVASGEKTLAIPRDLHKRVKVFCGTEDISIKVFAGEALQRLLGALEDPAALRLFKAAMEDAGRRRG